MNIRRKLQCVVFLVFASVWSIAQDQALHWYILKSTVPLNAGNGKVATETIRKFIANNNVEFNSKSNFFKVVAENEIPMEQLIAKLNQEGYFIADVTHNNEHAKDCLKCGYNFQLALMFCRNHSLFQTLTIDNLSLTKEEFDTFNKNDKQLLESSEILHVK